MKVVFFGTPHFAVPFLTGLIYSPDVEVEAVVTQPDKPVGRKQELTPPDVKVEAMKYDLPILQPEKIKGNKEFLELVKGLEPDFFVVIAYGMILPKELLDVPGVASVNVHASLLPKYRGASPIQTALLNGDKETGLTFMKMDEGMDTGGMYVVRKVPVGIDETADELSDKLAEIGAIMLPSTLDDIYEGVLSPLEQNEDEASYCTKISKKDAEIKPVDEDADSIFNKLRAFTPWPGIFMDFKGKRLKILEVHKSDIEALKPGELKEVDGKCILGTREGSLELKKLQMEGKNPCSDKDFINGFLS
jgi:methionyl-tRNA formyltransferase